MYRSPVSNALSETIKIPFGVTKISRPGWLGVFYAASWDAKDEKNSRLSE
jgi:hypothetical protein